MNTYRTACFSCLLALAALFAGCASASQHVPMPAQDVTLTSPELARIYVVRDDKAALHTNDVVVYDGELVVGTLTGRTYLCWERVGGRTIGRADYDAVDPGKGRIAGVADLDCPAGHVYFFLVSVAREGGKPEFVAIDEAKGRALVADRSPASTD